MAELHEGQGESWDPRVAFAHGRCPIDRGIVGRISGRPCATSLPFPCWLSSPVCGALPIGWWC